MEVEKKFTYETSDQCDLFCEHELCPFPSGEIFEMKQEVHLLPCHLFPVLQAESNLCLWTCVIKA